MPGTDPGDRPVDGNPGEFRQPVAPNRRFVLGLGAAVAAAAVVLTGLRLVGVGVIGSPHLHWTLIAVGFLVAEMFVVHFEHRRDSHAITFSVLPLVIGLYTVTPIALVSARLVGSGAALVYRRLSPLKIAVNLSSFWLETAVAVIVFRAVLWGDAPSVSTWPAAFAATLASDLVQLVVITAVISVYQRRVEILPMPALLGSTVSLVTASLALTVLTLLHAEPLALVPLVALGPVVFASLRVHARLREKHQNLEQLHAFTRHVGEAVLDDRFLPAMLRQVEELMHAESAWLCFGDRAAPGLDRRLHELAQGQDAPLLVSAADGGDLEQLLRRAGVREALVASLPHLSDGSATLVVANRSGQVRPFVPADLRLFATLVGVAGASLQNSHLLERLRVHAAESEYQSLHDALTGLPNRTMFQRELAAALVAGGSVAVLLLDLDRFKEVNDTLGHHVGDLLLQKVGRRVRLPLRQHDLVARLGGDEFAILLTDITGAESAAQVGNAVLAALEKQFELADVAVDVGGSIGIAVAPDHGTDAALLLQRADVAMYTAKADQSGVELYVAARDEYSADRLALAGEIRRAIEGRELEVHYQPQIDLRTGDVRGVEALVRWPQQPGRRLSPTELVHLAEQTGLIKSLTLLVLEQAVNQCAEWWRRGIRLRVSVNLSARTLMQPDLVGDVRRVLRDAGLPARGLCLELTETSIMGDPRRTAEMLERLDSVGVTIAIDDFGTGYSSLAYLKRLPVGEIKIDRSFVMGMATDTTDEAIVRSVLDLARHLSIPVVAEGVENEAVAATLRDLGCDLGQGYLYSKAVRGEELSEWLGAPADAPRLHAVG